MRVETLGQASRRTSMTQDEIVYLGSQGQLTLAWLLPRRTRMLEVQKHVSEDVVDWKKADGSEWRELGEAEMFRIDIDCETLQCWLANKCSSQDPEGGCAHVASLDLGRYWRLETYWTETGVEHSRLPSHEELRVIVDQNLPEARPTLDPGRPKRKASTPDERVELLLQWLRETNPERVTQARGKANPVRAAAEKWLDCTPSQFDHAWRIVLRKLQATEL